MATDAVLNYLKNENRPYSANDIVTNLQNKHSKSVVQNSLDKLVAKKEIFEKDSQHDAEELMRINRELEAHAVEVEMKRAEVEKSIRDHEIKLAALRGDLSLDDALNAKEETKKRVKEFSEKLDNIMESTGTEDLTAEKRKAEKIMKEYSQEYSKRKRLCTEILDCIMEGYPGSKKQLYEEIGIEMKIVQ